MHGIVSTPVIDPVARVVYVIGGMTDGHYEIHALSADTGMPVTSPAGWPVNSSAFKAGSVTFKRRAAESAQRVVFGQRHPVRRLRWLLR